LLIFEKIENGFFLDFVLLLLGFRIERLFEKIEKGFDFIFEIAFLFDFNEKMELIDRLL
jgi:hypothetical protein